MQNSVIQTKLALSRSQQNLQYIFMLVHLFGHKDEGGFDENILQDLRSTIEDTKNALITADQLLDQTLSEQSSLKRLQSAEIKLFRTVNH